MKYDFYNIALTEKPNRFEFISEGKNGRVIKRIEFSLVSESGLYNLSLGDIDENGNSDDKAITNNGDTLKIMATVALAALLFFEKQPHARIIISGNTPARTRLYRMTIGNNWEEVKRLFDVSGMDESEELVDFEKNIDYSLFLIQRSVKK